MSHHYIDQNGHLVGIGKKTPIHFSWVSYPPRAHHCVIPRWAYAQMLLILKKIQDKENIFTYVQPLYYVYIYMYCRDHRFTQVSSVIESREFNIYKFNIGWLWRDEDHIFPICFQRNPAFLCVVSFGNVQFPWHQRVWEKRPIQWEKRENKEMCGTLFNANHTSTWLSGWWFQTWLLFSTIYGIILPID